MLIFTGGFVGGLVLWLVMPALGAWRDEANALGVTTVYEAHAMDFSHLELYCWLRSTDQLTVRVQCAPEAQIYGMPGDQPLDVDRILARLQPARRRYGRP